MNAGVIDQSTLIKALNLQHRLDAPLGEILVAEGHANRTDVLSALAQQYQADRIDLGRDPPADIMAEALPARLCQRHGVVPWRWFGKTLLVATDHPAQIQALRIELGPAAPLLLPVIADRQAIHDEIGRLYGKELAPLALSCVPADQSCRGWANNRGPGRFVPWAIILLFLSCLVAAPASLMLFCSLIGIAAIVAVTTLKFAALMAQIWHQAPQGSQPTRTLPPRLPRISVLVPLFKEERIAEALLVRLSRLTYPKALLQVVLVLEAKDKVTRATLSRTDLPSWIHVIEVPDDGSITTKPRAMNYALDFCEGDIIGVWDAEDAPEPDQLEKVVTHFAHANPNVACVQGVLDYYNSRKNWMARCFTIEYAAWWRVLLPGISKLGMAIPLGGTTLFFKRTALEKLGRWDAHNVTEDADLGLRLARAGYVTDLVPTVTYEEANCLPWAWVKQRSRWMKGFLITYFVHMRNPRALLRDLGWRPFLGMQALFFASFVQIACLPIFWSFLLPTFGQPHVMVTAFGFEVVWGIAYFFIFAELLGFAIATLSVSGREHRHLLPWIVTIPVYFQLGALACYKALWEIVTAPYYWDKTQHGTLGGADLGEGEG